MPKRKAKQTSAGREELTPEAVGKERRAQEAAEEREGRLLESLEALHQNTARGLFRVAKMVGVTPIASDSKYLVDSLTWAQEIVSLAAAWKRFPRWNVTARQRIPGSQKGFEAARDIWRLASNGAPVGEVSARIDRWKENLGPAVREDGSRNRRRLEDTEIGILSFFRAIEEHFEEFSAKKLEALKERRRSRNPDPPPGGLKAGYARVCDMDENARLHLSDIIDLYGLGGVTVIAFRNSSKYFQRKRRSKREEWKLPLVPGRASQRRGKDGRLGPGRWWTAGEVKKAIEGWARKLDLRLPG